MREVKPAGVSSTNLLAVGMDFEFRKMPRLSQDLITEDLVREILLWLPVRSLVRFQSVSKKWRALIRDPNFIKLHLERSIQTLSERIFVMQCYWDEYCLVKLSKEGGFHKPMKVIISSSIPEWLPHISNHCNGLFCGQDNKKGIVIWNPSIRKHKTIPPVQVDAFNSHDWLFNVGIGYDSVTDDYKVVNIVQLAKFGKPVAASDILVYSLKESSWRRVIDKWSFKNTISRVGTYLNGSMHWLVEIEEIPNTRTALAAFDLTREKFQVHPFPVKCLSGCSLKVLGGNLCACTGDEVWMTEEYGVPSSWSLLYTRPTEFLRPRPLMLSEDGQEILVETRLMLSEDGQEILVETGKEYYWYDRVNKTKRKVRILDVPGNYRATLSQGSLVLLNGDNDDTQETALQYNSSRFFDRF